MSRCHGCTPVAKLIHVGVGQLHGLKKSATGPDQKGYISRQSNAQKDNHFIGLNVSLSVGYWARADRLEKHDREVIGETEQAKPYLMGNIVGN
ncbi:hypothetical protein MGG_17454 [Pyricularia oryzae 70-15]|uniref:Uncharacterized protein n=1 Tax=Pyricularia oryzae (strain 70-15 / ATCC MYA-4617 / FGSC 8958) TaxID=242507 RepID=G4NC34_PYRO7|nr:uncharacterized protein MGG_17454 [Pyricularia oryzae 70-15]EHA49037.1 hypothetical protein MGG_17454 [Pyricularia oryzae 70-15]